MSHVNKWVKETRNFRLQAAAETTYSTNIVGNKKIFQITAYGSENRDKKGDASQMIQFDKERAIELIGILKQEFNV